MARRTPRVSATIETGRLSTRTRSGSRAFYRGMFTKDARQGMAEIVRRYSEVVRDLKSATPDAIQMALMPVLSTAMYYCPRKTGLLLSTGEVGATEEGGKAYGWVKFGSPEAWYAAIVHERVDVMHAPPTSAKFLQRGLEEEIDNFLTSLAISYMDVFK